MLARRNINRGEIGGIRMVNMVTMYLNEYNRMKDETYRLKREIKKMEEDRIKELKEIFEIEPRYTGGVAIITKYGEIVKELYGDKIK